MQLGVQNLLDAIKHALRTAEEFLKILNETDVEDANLFQKSVNLFQEIFNGNGANLLDEEHFPPIYIKENLLKKMTVSYFLPSSGVSKV